jgi:DNA polymerase III sliding clamp (beta) subunit (PCNA family)
MKQKATFERDALELALSKSVKIIPQKIIIPALEHILVSICDGTAIFTSANPNAELIVKCPVKSKEMFSFCIPGKIFYKIVSMFKEPEVVISIGDDRSVIEIKSGKSKHKITSACAPDEFPVMASEKTDNEMVINEFYLKWALINAAKFCSNDELSSAQAINIHEKDNQIVFQSTNRFILFHSAIKPISIIQFSSVNVYPESANNLCTLLGDEAEITITCSKSKISFSNNEKSENYFCLKSTLYDGTFPETKALFSFERNNSVTFDVTELSNALKRLRLHAEDDSQPSISMDTTVSQECIMKSSNSLIGTDGEEYISVLGSKGNPLVKSFNNDYLKDALSVIETKEMILFFSDSNAPVKISPVDNKDLNNEVTILLSGRTS